MRTVPTRSSIHVAPFRRPIAAHVVALALAGPALSLGAQPGLPPDDPDSWRTAGTAKIICSALFVSGRELPEARAHLTSYFLGPKVDSITAVHVDSAR